MTPQADSSNPTEKKSWDYDLLSARLLVVIGWTLYVAFPASLLNGVRKIAIQSIVLSLSNT